MRACWKLPLKTLNCMWIAKPWTAMAGRPIALNGYNKTTVTTKPYTVARTDKTATVTITDQKAYADQYKPGGAAHTYDSGNPEQPQYVQHGVEEGRGRLELVLEG